MFKAQVTPEKVTIRRATTAAEVDGICELLQDLFVIERDFEPDRARQRTGLQRLSRRRDALLLVAEYEGRVIGMCTVQPLISTAEGGKVGLVEDVVVSLPYRRRGIGRRLLDAAVEWAEKQGMTRLQLLSDRNNRAASAFYAAAGWDTTRMIGRRLPLES